VRSESSNGDLGNLSDEKSGETTEDAVAEGAVDVNQDPRKRNNSTETRKIGSGGDHQIAKELNWKDCHQNQGDPDHQGKRRGNGLGILIWMLEVLIITVKPSVEGSFSVEDDECCNEEKETDHFNDHFDHDLGGVEL